MVRCFTSAFKQKGHSSHDAIHGLSKETARPVRSLTLAFLSLFTVLYARSRDTTMLSLLMLTPALSVLIVNKLTHERRSLFLRPKFKRNLSRYALSWLLPPLLAMVGAGIYFLLFPAQFQPLASRFAAITASRAERILDAADSCRFACGSDQSLRRTASGAGRGAGMAWLAASPAA